MFTPQKSPITGLIAALIVADLLAERAKATDPKRSGGLPPELAAIFPPELRERFAEKCGDPTCDGCYPTKEDQDRASASAANRATDSATSDSNASHVGQDAAAEGEARAHVSDVIEIEPDIAELVGVRVGVDPSSLEGHTRLLAAAFITNLRKLGEHPMKNFHEAGAALSGIAYAEKSVLSALRTFTELSK